MQNKKRNKAENGFTLIEVIVTIAIFLIIVSSAYGLYTAIIEAITSYRAQTTVSALANQYLEVARNLPYSKIGTLNGNPHGDLPDLPNAKNISFNGQNYQIYYTVTALHDPADSNQTVQDYKQIKLYIKNVSTGTESSFVTTAAPINLSQMGSGGAIAIQVIDQTWQPVSGASINISNNSINPSINLTRTSDASGRWSEIGLPPDSNYHISVTKNGYSTDSTYSVAEYPDAIAPDATVLNGQITQTTFIIDKLSSLAIFAKNQICQPISGVNINVQGSKLINPGTPKFNKDYITNGVGAISPSSATVCSNTCNAVSCCLEWDNYTPIMESSSYMIYGTSPIQSVNILPNTSQGFALILGPKTDNSLIAIAIDAGTGDPIENASVLLQGPGYSDTKYTGGSVWSQRDWSGGSGQDNFIDQTKYFQDDGRINTNTNPLALRLGKNGDDYFSSGSLTSSVFDTGTDETSYTTLTWLQGFPDPETAISFQVATSTTNDEETEWNFIGPGGTSDISDTYSVSGTTLNSANNNKRYVRYKVFLSTTNPAKTPVLSSVSINYVSGCPTPGQAMFEGLDAGNNYSATISAAGYEPQSFNNINVNGYFILQASLAPL